MKSLNGLLIYILLFLAAAAIGYKYGLKRDVTRVERDTVYAERLIHHRDTITNWEPKFIPVYVIDSSKDSTLAFIEKLDTVLSKDGDTLKLEIERRPYPVRYSLAFDFVKHDSVKTIYEKIYLDKKENWWNRFHIGIGAGIGVCTRDGDGLQLDAAPNLSIGIYYKLF